MIFGILVNATGFGETEVIEVKVESLTDWTATVFGELTPDWGFFAIITGLLVSLVRTTGPCRVAERFGALENVPIIFCIKLKWVLCKASARARASVAMVGSGIG